jgi:NADH-quinone oxidoreductase subunit J
MIQTMLFTVFSGMLLGSALMVILAYNPVKSALFLVLCFFSATGLWLLLNAEFLALVLILVYVGAVMTLFLFVVMTINVDFATLKQPYMHYYIPIGLFIAAILVALLVYALINTHAPFAILPASFHGISAANTVQLGDVLYTQYALPFEIAAVILLVAMIAAISLTVFQPIHRKQQDIAEQIQIRREDRVKLIK